MYVQIHRKEVVSILHNSVRNPILYELWEDSLPLIISLCSSPQQWKKLHKHKTPKLCPKLIDHHPQSFWEISTWRNAAAQAQKTLNYVPTDQASLYRITSQSRSVAIGFLHAGGNPSKHKEGGATSHLGNWEVKLQINELVWCDLASEEGKYLPLWCKPCHPGVTWEIPRHREQCWIQKPCGRSAAETPISYFAFSLPIVSARLEQRMESLPSLLDLLFAGSRWQFQVQCVCLWAHTQQRFD